MGHCWMKFGLLALFSLLMISCTVMEDAPLYTWYDYGVVRARYRKDSTVESKEALRAEYINIWLGQKTRRKVVPPGIAAEYGLMLYKEGNTQDGLSYLRKEMELYPESKACVSKIINQLQEK